MIWKLFVFFTLSVAYAGVCPSRIKTVKEPRSAIFPPVISTNPIILQSFANGSTSFDLIIKLVGQNHLQATAVLDGSIFSADVQDSHFESNFKTIFFHGALEPGRKRYHSKLLSIRIQTGDGIDVGVNIPNNLEIINSDIGVDRDGDEKGKIIVIVIISCVLGLSIVSLTVHYYFRWKNQREI